MSIYFDFHVGPRSRRFRRAVGNDETDIDFILKSAPAHQLFGAPDIGSLLELSTLSICMINEKKEVIGFMALSDHPDIPCVDPADWEVWIRNMFQKYYLSRNTLFIHFMCCVDEVATFFIDEALVSVFQNDSYLSQIVLVVHPHCPKAFLERYCILNKRNIHQFFATSEDNYEGLSIYTASRQEFCPKLRIRRAVEEDNDDIIEILDKSCPRLKELYGEYYISEIIGRHPEINRKIIVAEHHEKAIGVMCLCSEINYTMLQNTYDLSAFHGLRKATPLERELYRRNNELYNLFGMPIMLGNWSPFDKVPRAKTGFTNLNFEQEHKQTKKIAHKVYFRSNKRKHHSDDTLRKEVSGDYPVKGASLIRSDSVESNFSVASCILEEDPFDYDIVNIDSNLLTVPNVLSCDFSANVRNQGPRRSHGFEFQNRIKRRASPKKSWNVDESETLKYSGEPNAFAIELFGLKADVDDRSAFDFLEAAFEAMKDYDYCIIRVPCTEKSFPLLQHFCFVPVKINICSPYALYVAHRSAILSKLRVRKAEFVDVPQIAQLLHNLDGKETIATLENTIMKRNEYKAYVFISGVSLVGVGILEPPEQIDFVRAKFNLHTYHSHNHHLKGQGVNAGFSTLKAILVYPAFEPHCRFFLRDMMRLSSCTTLVWLTGYRNKWMIHKANSIVSSMVPLLPRKSEIDCIVISEFKKFQKLSKIITAFSSWFMDNKLTSVPKVNVDTRMVVVGASRTTMAFLNTLLFSDCSSYLTFTSVTVISPYGLPYARKSKHINEMMFPRYRTHSDKFLKSTPYTYYMNVIQGTVVEICKQDKYVILENGNRYYYDLLFLFFGKQFQRPDYMKAVIKRERAIKAGEIPKYTRLDMPQPDKGYFINEKTPYNFFVINHSSEANKALVYVKSLITQDSDYTIIVYGAYIHAYCCLATLLEMNIPPSNIIFVEPFPPEDQTKPRISVFCNKYVDRTVSKMLEDLKIKVYRSFYFKSYHVNSTNFVTSAQFVSDFNVLRIECSAMFYYGNKGINEQAFVAINKSGIAYNSGILIDHECKTKDPSIYAAGPATRYYARYYADFKRQKYYDSYEIGEKLGMQIKNLLDPLFTETKPTATRFSPATSGSTNCTTGTKISEEYNTKSSNNALSESEDLKSNVPVWNRPITIYCILPGGLQYLDVRSPGMKIPHYYVQSLHYNGYIMETFKSGYFKLHLTKDHVVDGITCLTPEKYSLDNFKKLYGLSAVVLNNVHLRFTAKKLDNFYDFFRSPWAFFLYHDQADELFAMVKQLLPKGQREGETLEEALRSVGGKLSDISLGSQSNQQVRTNFEKSPYIEAITEYILKWVQEHDVLLPMYLRPCQRVEYCHDEDRNPVFRRKRSLSQMLSAIY